MICPNCGTNLNDGTKECIMCGYWLETKDSPQSNGDAKPGVSSAHKKEEAKKDQANAGSDLTTGKRAHGSRSKKRAGIIGGLCAAGGAAAALIILFAVTGQKQLSLEEQLASLEAKAQTANSEELEVIYKEAEEVGKKIEESAKASIEAEQASSEAAAKASESAQVSSEMSTTAQSQEATLSQSQSGSSGNVAGAGVIEAQPATIISKAGNILNTGQVDSYTFDAPNDGRYRAEVTGMGSHDSVEVEFLDPYGNVLEAKSECRNGDGVTVKDLVAGSRYEVRVSETAGNTPYLLSVGLQKPALDISNVSEAKDSVEYTDQRNLYNFTPTSTGDYRFELTGVDSGVLLDMFAFDYPGNKLDSIEAIGSGSGLTLKNLKAGEEYEIQVRQSKGLGGYTLVVK